MTILFGLCGFHYLLTWLCQFLVASCGVFVIALEGFSCCGMWDPSFPTRDRTHRTHVPALLTGDNQCTLIHSSNHIY